MYCFLNNNTWNSTRNSQQQQRKITINTNFNYDCYSGNDMEQFSNIGGINIELQLTKLL